MVALPIVAAIAVGMGVLSLEASWLVGGVLYLVLFFLDASSNNTELTLVRVILVLVWAPLWLWIRSTALKTTRAPFWVYLVVWIVSLGWMGSRMKDGAGIVPQEQGKSGSTLPSIYVLMDAWSTNWCHPDPNASASEKEIFAKNQLTAMSGIIEAKANLVAKDAEVRQDAPHPSIAAEEYFGKWYGDAQCEPHPNRKPQRWGVELARMGNGVDWDAPLAQAVTELREAHKSRVVIGPGGTFHVLNYGVDSQTLSSLDEIAVRAEPVRQSVIEEFARRPGMSPAEADAVRAQYQQIVQQFRDAYPKELPVVSSTLVSPETLSRCSTPSLTGRTRFDECLLTGTSATKAGQN